MRVVLRAANQNTYDCQWQSYNNSVSRRSPGRGESVRILYTTVIAKVHRKDDTERVQGKNDS